MVEGKKGISLAGGEKVAGGGLSERVTPVLFGARAVAANPSPGDVVTAAFPEKRLPKIAIRYRDAAGRAPIPPAPFGQMPGHRALNVLRIRHDFHHASLFQG